MNIKILLKAASQPKNLGILGFITLVTGYTQNLPFFFAGMAGYTYLLLQSMKDENFKKEVEEQKMLETIRTYEQEISKCLFEIRQTENRTAFSKLREVLKDKDDIIGYFNKGEKSEIKFQVVTQVLNLVLSYLKILLTYIKRSNEFDMIEIDQICNRIERNRNKLKIARDNHAIEDLNKAIAVDEETLHTFDEEKLELEKLGAKINYIESKIDSLKNDLLTSTELDTTIKEVDSLISESEAIENVLEERRKNRLR